MDYVQLNTILQKGEIIKMPNENDRDSSTQNGNSRSNESELKNTIIKLDTTIKWMRYIFCISIPIITALFGVIAAQIYSLNATVATNTSQIQLMAEDLDDVKESIYGSSTTTGIKSRLETIETKLDIPVISASTESEISIALVKDGEYIVYAGNIVSDTYIGSDSSGKEYIAKDLVDQPSVLTYLEGNNEVYFLGQFNDNYNWNGYCVTNVYYPDGSLCGICESNFDDGKRLDYKSIFVSDNSTGDEWTYSDRVSNDNNDTGINITYKFVYDKIKNFTSTNVRISDIIYVDKFMQEVGSVITKYYSGSTSNSLFNDSSGQAYEAKYYDDGTIKTLYMGNFVSGEFNDSTGNAWCIAYSEDDKGYIYHKGIFENDYCQEKSCPIISTDEINKIVSKFDLKCELNWKHD